MTDRLMALKVFAQVARGRSFSQAARQLGLSQPSVSRIVSKLERDLGVTLLVRTTRAGALTAKGADYLANIEPILAALTDADNAVRRKGDVIGVLRVALSSSFCIREVIPCLPEFLRQHPRLRVDLRINDDTRQDLITDGIDMAFRFGKLANSGAVARKLARAPRLLIASPTYLAQAGSPNTPDDLDGHVIIVGPAGMNSDAWSFSKDGITNSKRIDGRVSATSHEAVIAAAVAGVGITVTSVWGCRVELQRGALVRVLANWLLDPVDVHAVFPPGRATAPAARLFADYMMSALAKPPTW